MTTIQEIFSTIDTDPSTHLDYSFSSENDMDNIESMRDFLESHDLEEYVSEDLGTLVTLDHPEYDFKVAVTSEGLGDFFSHGIYVFKSED